VNHHVEAGDGAPGIFLTFSCAENQWPDIQRVLRERAEIAGEPIENIGPGKKGYQKYLNDYSIVVQEFFQERVRLWLNTYGKTVLGIVHHWIRYEFAPGRGQIHAHILCITNDPVLRDLTFIKGRDVDHADALSDYLAKKHGTTASVPDGLEGVEDRNACKKFREVLRDGSTAVADAEALLRQCQMHNCSKFCMPKDRRTCKVGCGKEETKGKCDTPGFPLTNVAELKKDHKGITKLFMPRTSDRLVQSSSFVLQSWRGNCDLQSLLYKSSPDSPDIGEIAQVVDYVIAYSCKGNSTLREELTQAKNLVMGSIELTGGSQDVHRVCKHVLNKAASSRLI
jgi:hypothetical protein